VSASPSPRGVFVTLEGGEGCGKTTQLTALELLARGDDSPWAELVTCREPGGTAIGEGVRDLLFDRPEDATDPTPPAELLLFAAARAQLVAEVIRPALERGALVICDRFADSTTAYQAYGRELDRSLVDGVNAAATGGLTPELTVLLDLDPKEGLVRSGRRDAGEPSDYLEREELAFHRRVRLGYLELAAAEPERWVTLDATRPAMELSHAIWERVRGLVG
jgi:dTMP kinase